MRSGFIPMLLIGLSVLVRMAEAGDVTIVDASGQRQAGQWRFDVTLQHRDSGWDHYADRWQIIDAKGNVLGQRILYHPHEQQQPFTRSLTGVSLPDDIDRVFIEAHDSVHGWAAIRFTVTLDKH